MSKVGHIDLKIAHGWNQCPYGIYMALDEHVQGEHVQGESVAENFP